MLTKPLNENTLWKSTMQKAGYVKPTIKQPMRGLTLINPLTGTIVHGQVNLSEEINMRWLLTSKIYWEGVNERKALYRKNSNTLYNAFQESQSREQSQEQSQKWWCHA